MIKSSFWRFFGRFVVLCFMALCGIPGFADNITTSPANCNSATLNTSIGPATLNADWEANNINITWFNDGTQITNDANAATQCTYDQTFSLPTPPTKTGYNFAGWKAMPVPSIYTQLEYIQSTGTQYIDTNITANQTSDATIDYQSTVDGLKWLFGARDYSNGTAINKFSTQGISTSSNTFWIQFDNTSALEYRVDTNITTQSQRLSRHKVRLSGNKCYLDDNLIYTLTESYTDFSSTHTLLIGNNYSTSGISSAGLSAKIYSFVYYKDGALVFYGVPVRRNSDNIVGMYDTVTGQFFTNAGSGNFEAGPAVQ